MITLIKKWFSFKWSKTNPPLKATGVASSSTRPSTPRISNKEPMFPKADEQQTICEKMRWGVAGFGDHSFCSVAPTRPDNPWLADRMAQFAKKKLHNGTKRDLAAGLDLALSNVLDYPSNRATIITILAGASTSDELALRQLHDEAVERGVGIHCIFLGDTEAAEKMRWFCTKSDLGYGTFHCATTKLDFERALEDAIEGCIPRPWIKGFNRCIFSIDCTPEMGKPFVGDSISKMRRVSQSLAALAKRQAPERKKPTFHNKVLAVAQTS